LAKPKSPGGWQISPGSVHQVEATKFTEVGYHGRDVDSIIRDLLDSAIKWCAAR